MNAMSHATVSVFGLCQVSVVVPFVRCSQLQCTELRTRCTGSKTLDIVRGLLFRENEQTALEGSRAGSASHGSPKAKCECNSRASRAVHSTKNE